MSTEELIESITNKVRIIAKSRKELELKVEKLKGDIESLKLKSDQDKLELNEVKERLKIVKMAKSLDEVDEKGTDSKYKINQLVKEIDKCISMLNN